MSGQYLSAQGREGAAQAAAAALEGALTDVAMAAPAPGLSRSVKDHIVEFATAIVIEAQVYFVVPYRCAAV